MKFLRWLTAFFMTWVLIACGGGGGTPGAIKAGPDQNVRVGATVVLQGTDTLAPALGVPPQYLWELASRPEGSSAALLNATSLTGASFTADMAGVYKLSLTVRTAVATAAGAQTSFMFVTATREPAPAPVAPLAHAGPDQSVKKGSVVTLDGTASSDANGDLLTARWTLLEQPAGSTATLSGATTLRPSFTADLVGAYRFSLVVNDGKLDSSNTATVTVMAATVNAAPVAHAGTEQKVNTGTQVALDGSASSDADGDPLTARWSLTAKPAGSAAALDADRSMHPRFLADLAGSYTAALVVNDGQLDSNTATVTVTAAVANVAPVAHAGPNQQVQTGTQVMLDGRASSDANGDPLSASWTLTSKPQGSIALLASPNTFTPTFVADLPGTYSAALIVNDGKLSSATSTVTITATPPAQQLPDCQPKQPNC